MLKRFVYLIFLLSASLSHSNSLGEALLKKAQDFQEKYNSQKTHSLNALDNDDLAKLPKKDFEFLKSRLKIYGLAPFEVSGTKLILTIEDSNQKFEVDYQNIDLSALVIQGIQYPINLKQDLQKLYEVDYKKAFKAFKKQNASLWEYTLFPLTLSSCVNSSSAFAESAANSNSIPLAYLKLCAECASAAIYPTGTFVGAATALSAGVMKGIEDKSFKSCGIEFCKNLPVVKGFLGVYNAHKNSTPKTEHSK